LQQTACFGCDDSSGPHNSTCAMPAGSWGFHVRVLEVGSSMKLYEVKLLKVLRDRQYMEWQNFRKRYPQKKNPHELHLRCQIQNSESALISNIEGQDGGTCAIPNYHPRSSRSPATPPSKTCNVKHHFPPSSPSSRPHFRRCPPQPSAPLHQNRHQHRHLPLFGSPALG
jgi:hypothetical protein